MLIRILDRVGSARPGSIIESPEAQALDLIRAELAAPAPPGAVATRPARMASTKEATPCLSGSDPRSTT